MRVQIKTFSAAVKTVMQAVKDKATIPQNRHVFFKNHTGRLLSYGTNTTQYIEADLGACEETINCAVFVKTLKEFLIAAAKMKYTEIAIEANHVIAYKDGGNYACCMCNQYNFNPYEITEKSEAIRVPAEILHGLNKFTAGKEEFRRTMRCIGITKAGLCGTDGKRLIYTDSYKAITKEMLIGQEAVDMIKDSGEVNISWIKSIGEFICIQYDNIKILDRFTGYGFPDFKQCVPVDYFKKLVIPNELTEWLKTVKDNAGIYRFELEYKESKFTAKSDNPAFAGLLFEASTEIKDAIRITFNCKFFYDCITVFELDCIKYKDSISPFKFEYKNGAISVLMPFRAR